jgi:hypothetical protein
MKRNSLPALPYEEEGLASLNSFRGNELSTKIDRVTFRLEEEVWKGEDSDRPARGGDTGELVFNRGAKAATIKIEREKVRTDQL